jgi:hypothetical protein
MRHGYALELDSLLLTELRNARRDFDEGITRRRSLTSPELSAVTGESIDRVRARLRAIEAAGEVFEDRVRDRWTITTK